MDPKPDRIVLCISIDPITPERIAAVGKQRDELGRLIHTCRNVREGIVLTTTYGEGICEFCNERFEF